MLVSFFFLSSLLMSVNVTIHKPDDASAELPPPPPYSREPRTSDTGAYGSINEEQVRLLGNTSPISKQSNNNRGFSDGPRKLLVSCIDRALNSQVQ